MPALVALAGLYLALLFLIAWGIGRAGSITRVLRHPLSYTLTLGVYASSWSYFGNVGFAERNGLLFLATQIGKTFAVMLAPAVGGKILALTRDHQLTSVADLFAFRYRSRLVGFLITLVSLIATLPYLAQQVRAVVGSLDAMTGTRAPALVGIGFCAALALFAILFGTRDVSPRVQRDGLTAALAFESLVKLSALLAVGAAAVAGFGGLGRLDEWLAAHPEQMRALHAPLHEGGSWSSLLLLSFTSAFLMPRQFHVAFAEGTTTRSLRVAAWAFPVYLLLLNLPILPILWAGGAAHPAGDPDYYAIAVARDSGSPTLAAFTFLGGISAASAMALVTLLALSAMCLNYFVNPFVLLARPAAPPRDLYRWLLWARRALIVALALASWGTFELFEGNRCLVEWGIGSFVAIAQFFPGLVGVLFWRRATARGLVAGLAAGIGVWIPTSFLPLFRAAPMSSPIASMDPLTFATFTSLSVNVLLFGAVSLLFPARPDEEEAASICVDGAALGPATPAYPARSPAELHERLARFLGARVAEQETSRAARDLELASDEASPLALRRLGERVEQNLSGMMGPLLARLVVQGSISGDSTDAPTLDEQLRALDEQLALGGPRLHGIAAELDTVRRFLGALLDDLPLGICALDHEGRIVLYNRTMEGLTGVAARAVEGRGIVELPLPWGQELGAIVASTEGADVMLTLTAAEARRSLRVQRFAVDLPAPSAGSSAADRSGLVLLVEDTTERRKLETQLAHQDRLASIGRLAAGAAHGFGNPLNNIGLLAQNLEHNEGADDVRARRGKIIDQVQRIDVIVRALLNFSRVGALAGPTPVPTIVGVHALVDEAVNLARLDPAAKNLAWESRCDLTHTVFGDRQQLQQVLVNLLTNAADASPESGTVIVESVVESGLIVLRILDEGPGLAPELADHVFEPFITTKAPNAGTGLGLYVTYGIVRDHGGTIAIDREGGARTVVSVRLPIGESQ